MKIHVFVDVYPHPYKPYFDVQLEEWQNAGHQVCVISLSRIPGAVSPIPVITAQTLREAPVAVGLKMIAALLRSPRRMSVAFSAGRGLLGKVKLVALDCQLPRELPDLFFVHNLAAGVRFAYLKRIFPRIPFALYYHGGELPGVCALDDDTTKRALIAPDIVFSNTQYSIDDVVRRGADPSKVKRIPVGFRLDDYHFDSTRRYLRDNRVQLMSVGRVSVEKGFDIAIRSLQELCRQTHIELEYTLVGDGPEMENIRVLAQKSGVSDFVNFVGKLSSGEVIQHLKKADVLIVSSVPGNTWEENQACVMQEAMLLGVVVVASDIGGVRESLPQQMRNYLFEAGNYLQLAQNVEQLLAGGLDNMKQLGAIGHAFVVENYDLQSTNQMLLHEVASQKV